jgi:CRISPR-associated endoribonuclease Cas6
LRIKLHLLTYSGYLSPNYHYPLSGVVYRMLRLGSPEFSAFLHDTGFSIGGKKYKLFTFALRFAEIKITKNKICLLRPDAELFISTPLVDDFIRNFVTGTFEQQSFEIYNDEIKTIFKIEQVEVLPEQQLKQSAKFILYSPLVLSTKRECSPDISRQNNNDFMQYYLRPDDTDDINRVLTSNLVNKYRLLFNKDINTEDLKLQWDNNYLQKHKRVTKKITIPPGDKRTSPIDIIGVQAPFTLEGNAELIKTGYDCGFGEKNSIGFGYAEIQDQQFWQN